MAEKFQTSAGQKGMGCAELYLHIPFCVRKCGYCDFLSFCADGETKEQYVRALIREIRAAGEALSGTRIVTVFIGGGTPTVLESGEIGRIFDAVRDSFSLDAEAEITVEVNPGTADEEKLRALWSFGVNRLSIGCQSLDDRLLLELGRIHDREAFFHCFCAARRAGFKNISVDLMSAIPDQSYEDWVRTLREAAELGPEHISAYSLILEEGTPFFERKDSLHLPDEDTERRMYEDTRKILSEYGYERYEISNYAKNGRRCRHNVGYWTGVPYAGLGLGASSYLGNMRFRNTDRMDEYLEYFGETARARNWMDAPVHCERELLSDADRMAEFVILGLRMIEGISEEEFFCRFGKNLADVYGETIAKHRSEGLLEEKGGRVFLTERGVSLSNYVMCDFLPG
jgi:oxygen-independent coproporphyrinogen-3 oxidase